MQPHNKLNVPGEINIEYLKDNISEDEILLLYWYIIAHEEEFTNAELALLYEFFTKIDDKLNEDDEDQTDVVYA